MRSDAVGVGGIGAAGHTGYYWSATLSSSTNSSAAYDLYIGNPELHPYVDWGTHYYGTPLHCLVR